MRLKARFRDPVTFLRIMQTMAKLSPRCILRFKPDAIHVVIPRGADSVEAWAEMDVIQAFFRDEDYTVESNFENQINLEIATDVVCQALRLTTSASAVTMKLGKKDGRPTLNFEIATRSPDGQEVVVLHQVLIAVKKPREMTHIRSSEDAIGDGQYSIRSLFPDLSEVRIVAERMRTLNSTHDRITIATNLAGEMKLEMQGDAIKVETQWHGLQQADIAAELAHRPVSTAILHRFRHVRLDMRAFIRFLACQVTDYTAEVWMMHKVCATFAVHVRKAGANNPQDFVAHILIKLPGLGSGYDD